MTKVRRARGARCGDGLFEHSETDGVTQEYRGTIGKVVQVDRQSIDGSWYSSPSQVARLTEQPIRRSSSLMGKSQRRLNNPGASRDGLTHEDERAERSRKHQYDKRSQDREGACLGGSDGLNLCVAKVHGILVRPSLHAGSTVLSYEYYVLARLATVASTVKPRRAFGWAPFFQNIIIVYHKTVTQIRVNHVTILAGGGPTDLAAALRF